jgi:hypothetical protein
VLDLIRAGQYSRRVAQPLSGIPLAKSLSRQLRRRHGDRDCESRLLPHREYRYQLPNMAAPPPTGRVPSSPAIVPAHASHGSASSLPSTFSPPGAGGAYASPFGGTVGSAGRGSLSAYAHPDALQRAHPSAVACVAIVGKSVRGSAGEAVCVWCGRARVCVRVTVT